MTDRLFRMKADFQYYAEDIDDAFRLLSVHFNALTTEDGELGKGLIHRGKITIGLSEGFDDRIHNMREEKEQPSGKD